MANNIKKIDALLGDEIAQVVTKLRNKSLRSTQDSDKEIYNEASEKLMRIFQENMGK